MSLSVQLKPYQSMGQLTSEDGLYEHYWTHPTQFEEWEGWKWNAIRENWEIKLVTRLDKDDTFARQVCKEMIEYCSVRAMECQMTYLVAARMTK